ncbi:hypothetical protein GCM10010488_09540 [Oerskovia jenensis]
MPAHPYPETYAQDPGIRARIDTLGPTGRDVRREPPHPTGTEGPCDAIAYDRSRRTTAPLTVRAG